MPAPGRTAVPGRRRTMRAER